MKTLSQTLENLDWNANVISLLQDIELVNHLDEECRTLALWVTGFIKYNKDSNANAFAFQMLSASQHAIALISLGLYTPAAGSLRGMFESALYFLYFRNHPLELQTLIRDTDYYIQKSEILEFFSKHTPEFISKQQNLGLISKINQWYKDVSSVIHAQIPGSWGGPKDLNTATQNLTIAKNIAKSHTQAVTIINQLFLITVGTEIWGSISVDSRKVFLKGIQPSNKRTLKLDVLGTA